MADLLYVQSPPAGETKLTDWAMEHRDTLGRKYASELARRRNRLARAPHPGGTVVACDLRLPYRSPVRGKEWTVHNGGVAGIMP